MNHRRHGWQFWIDVGGTFTDCIGVNADGELRQFKTLSSGVTRGTPRRTASATMTDRLRANDPEGFWDGATCRLLSATGDVIGITRVVAFSATDSEFQLVDDFPSDAVAAYELNLSVPAPVLAIRWLMGLPAHDICPPVSVRFGTTRGTNALLTRTGARTALLTTKGFTDVPLIGNQDRPHLFDLDIRKPEPLFAEVFGIDERVAADGGVLMPLQISQLRELLPALRSFDSVAVCLLNSYANSSHEDIVAEFLAGAGFEEVSRSSEVSPLIRFVPRCETTVLDAYLNPVLRDYLQQLQTHLRGSDIQVMTSIGGLVPSERFRGRDCVLSGPAGGIVGFSTVAQKEGFPQAIGFDMGGTSTDVARFCGRFEFENETVKAGVRIMTPMLAIETVAAGGGSICGFDGTRLFVGPQSAGAEPGPACYGAGGPLTVTDLNVFLGRVLPEHFPFQLNTQAIEQRLSELRASMRQRGVGSDHQSLKVLAEGLLQIANDNMVNAIRKVSVAKGYLPADHALVSFGGAGGQHACGIARRLKMRHVLIHPFAGILSAFGMGQADARAIRQVSVLKPLTDSTLDEIDRRQRELAAETWADVSAQGVSPELISEPQLRLELRYAGTDSALMVDESRDRSFERTFTAEHLRLFGYVRESRAIEVASMLVETIGRAASAVPAAEAVIAAAVEQSGESTSVWFDGHQVSAAVLQRKALNVGELIPGPAIICETTSTIFVEPNCVARVLPSGTLQIEILVQDSEHTSAASASPLADAVMLEVMNNQFVSIAQQMGETLRRTSISTNVRERLDFSCALFDADGHLVVNAPHVPVHLGAMSETVRAVMADHSEMQPGDVYVTNDPFRGGSHLPDVTVVTPVFCGDVVSPTSRRPDFYVANRSHHAEIGGIVPGSMPPFSKNLAEEGVLIRSRKLVDNGRSCEIEIAALLSGGDFPSRAVSDNLSDLAAQVAANKCGVHLLQGIALQYSTRVVLNSMRRLQETAAQKMRQCLNRIEDGRRTFADTLDDGSQICVSVQISGDAATVDFTGTSGVHSGNLNANRAITTAAVLYSFRCLLNEDVTLNAGVLEPVELIIPAGLLNPTAGPTPETSPAVVGGNVETSQRIVDALLGALGLAAASQGTMNNLTFGDETFGYYETICGGAGATPSSVGCDAVHTHMTNTRLTDPEVLEQRYPVRLSEFGIRKNSGGVGKHRGGDGVVRTLEFLKPLQVSMLSQRRDEKSPYGIAGGTAGQPGCNQLILNGETHSAGCFSVHVDAGAILRIQTPGGGAFGWLSETEPSLNAEQK